MTDSIWEIPVSAPKIRLTEAHIWRIPLDEVAGVDAHHANLSTDEQTRARRFHSRQHALRYTVAHGMLRRILSTYTGVSARALTFARSEFGKPYLSQVEETDSRYVHFNLSHSADIALVAVSVSGNVGVDVEFWRDNVRHLEVAERFFSVAERQALRALGGNVYNVTRGFFSGWSRKEAYLKASGLGISRGLDHFDVSLEPTAPASILADRRDTQAVTRWEMANVDVGAGYSAAIVATAPLSVVRLYDASLNDTSSV
ncbi:MAG: 4'-phosphopantetheinyl transferase superfamily protein [Gemmatimonadaceae bacterium]